MDAALTQPDSNPNNDKASTPIIVQDTCASRLVAGLQCPDGYVFAFPPPNDTNPGTNPQCPFNGTAGPGSGQALPDNTQGSFNAGCCVSGTRVFCPQRPALLTVVCCQSIVALLLCCF